jgi:hypothetical protein
VPVTTMRDPSAGPADATTAIDAAAAKAKAASLRVFDMTLFLFKSWA